MSGLLFACLISLLALTVWVWLGESATAERSESGGLAIFPARRFMALFPAMLAMFVIAILSSSKTYHPLDLGLLVDVGVIIILGANLAYGHFKGASVRGPALVVDRQGLDVDVPFAHLGHLDGSSNINPCRYTGRASSGSTPATLNRSRRACHWRCDLVCDMRPSSIALS
jgi:hypothetical protein